MDFTQFVRREAIPALKWLGMRDWLEFGYSADFTLRTIWTRPKELTISPEERRKYNHWDQVDYIIDNAQKDVITSFLALALSRSIASGPKVFQPTIEDCAALENTTCTVAFEDYKQPYPVIIIELPKEYRKKLAGPTHVLVHYEPGQFIAVHAFFARNDVISHITPMRPEYKTIEDAITYNKRNTDEFAVAELSQRLAVNFCMVMVLLGVKDEGPLDKEAYEKAKKLASSSDKKRANLGKRLLSSVVNRLAFVQKIKLYEEEVTYSRKSGDGTHASPRPHWRRGHYRNQRCGARLVDRRLVFIKPVLVMASAFSGDLSNTEVVYTLEKP
jgi:hypothetical protein